MASVTRLPAEILELIAAHSKREDLKALRLADRAFSTVVTAKLFEEMHISPNSYSFDRAHCVAGQSQLSRHVRSLVYHFGKLAEVYVGFDAFKREYFAARRTGVMHDPYEVTSEVLWSYNCWLEEIDAQRTFELRYEAEELCDLCDRLPRLEAISTVLDEANPFGDQEDYIGKRTGMAAIEDDGWSRFPRLFTAAIGKPLHKISARSIQWHNLGFMEEGSDEEIRASQDCLSRLRFLELGIYRTPHDFENESGDEPDKVEYLHHVDLLDAVLQQAHRLEVLKLDFDELPFESQTQTMLPVSRAIFKHQWPRLRELKLEAICVYEDEFCDFLLGHRATLKRLCIGDIELASRAEEIPSILSVFLRIRGFLCLQSCKITGNFTNRTNQAWYVDTEYDYPGCLRDQLEGYLCGVSTKTSNIEGGDAEKESLWQSGAQLELWLHKMGEDYEALQDDSWQWAPELLLEPLTPSD